MNLFLKIEAFDEDVNPDKPFTSVVIKVPYQTSRVFGEPLKLGGLSQQQKQNFIKAILAEIPYQ